MPEVRRALVELCRAHLVTEHAPGRYTCHDLLRAYAAELVLGQDREPDRQAATRRLLDYYLHTGHQAATLLYLGDSQRAAGDREAAQAAWSRALTILDRIGYPDAARVRARLAA